MKKGQQNNDEKSIAYFPDAWRLTAIGLQRSADIIWENWYLLFSKIGGQPAKLPQNAIVDLAYTIGSFLLLSGLALENLLKGILIARNKAKFKEVIRWNIHKGGHDLMDLCGMADIELTDREKKIIDALTEAVLWAGRYPVPKKHLKQKDLAIPLGCDMSGMTVDNIHSIFENYKKNLDSIFIRILRKLELYIEKPEGNGFFITATYD